MTSVCRRTRAPRSRDESGRLADVSVELHRPAAAGQLPFIVVLWPLRPSMTNPFPRAIADFGRAVVRVLSAAQAELVQIQRGDGMALSSEKREGNDHAYMAGTNRVRE
jgi:hypothetical protein